VTAPHPAVRHRGGGITITAGDVVLTAAQARAIADGLYDGVEADRVLRPKFGGDIAGERVRLGALLSELFGGEAEWSRQFGSRDLASAHRIIHISAKDAARWVGHFRQAATAAVGDDAARALTAAVRPVAETLVNEPDDAAKGAKREARYEPTRRAVKACERGDLDTLRALLDDAPQLTSPADPGAPELLAAAVRRGRLAIVEELLARDVDVNLPATAGGLRITALCEARHRRGREIEARLRAAGAVDDIYTAAYLGDTQAILEAAAADPGIVDEPDPASDVLRATALDHAVLGAAPASTVPLFRRLGARAPAHGHTLLHAAATADLAEVVADLLEMGADARFVTPGRWILHPAPASLLLGAGTDVNHAPTRWDSWIWRSCTGNKGAREDPAYVRALLDSGADVTARIFGGKTALHFAAKAGFADVARELLDAGADLGALDDDGRSPIDHARRCADTTKRAAVTDFLVSRSA
jgi:truncated hemoglobin YjbI/ankyrin repeat protein